MSHDPTASASYLGYLYQARVALLLMLQEGKVNPSLELSIEKIDDISFQAEQNPLTVVQTKHHVNGKGNLTDASDDLWKSIRIWCEIFNSNKYSKDNLRFAIMTTAEAPENSIASNLRKDARNVKLAVSGLKGVAEISTNQENQQAYDAFKKLDDFEKESLLEKVYIFDSNENIANIEKLIKNELRISTREAYLNYVFERVEGWWIGLLISHLSEQSERKILYRELSSKIQDVADQYRMDNLPIDFVEEITKDESEMVEEQRVFIEQLKLIAVSNERVRIAISDYYRAFEQRSKWVRDGLIFDEEIKSYEDELVDEWKRLHLSMKESLGSSATEQVMQQEGRNHYNDVQQLNINIREKCIKPFIMRGSFHMLANRLSIGWHPEFLERLNALIAKAEGA